MVKNVLETKKYLREYLYSRGFLITDNEVLNTDDYPFYGNWFDTVLSGLHFIIHKNLKLYTYETDRIFFMIGHAYNPFNGMYNESDILKYMSECEDDKYYSALNELTGVFITGVISEGNISFIGDATCMQSVFYGNHGGNVYISSHTQLIGDICQLSFDDFISELVNYKYYHLFGRMLPGDLTPYSDFKRLVPNFEVTYYRDKKNFYKKRFYPTDKIIICNSTYNDLENNTNYLKLISQCYDILRASMDLIPKKWERPAILLTGGCDSKTTLSCVKNLSDYSYFSYVSVEKEKPDAEAAHKISELLGIKHTIYDIPVDNREYRDFDEIKEILECNGGYIGKNNENDIRKRIYFAQRNDFDIEVKSWVSEAARAYFHKRFDKPKLPKKVTPRILTTVYKVFLDNRALVRKVDKVFDNYLNEYYTDEIFDMVPWYDILFWEYRLAAWNGLVISNEQKYSFDITIPYNNRNLLWLLLSTPIEKRINDIPHKDIQRLGNKLIADMDISVVNVEHTRKRAKLEGLYFDIHSRLPI